ncbi:MAG: MBL fold metallo-hydrolase [Acidimicrobiia bacterium]|nr:MBL fold metallo-hydrolase [Acidimicrobiia bacterium]
MAPLPRLTYVGHATVLIEAAGVRVLTDPVLTDRIGFLRRVVPRPDPADHRGVDVVLLSHLHHDHLHLPSLRRVGELGHQARVLAPRGSAPFLARRGVTDVVEVVPGDVVVHGPVTFRVTPAAHDDRRWPLRGPRADPVGFLVEAQGTSTYFAGDTDLFPEMDELCPDVALLPVWGWGTGVGVGHLDPQRAAEALVRLGSAYAVPIHWGTFFPHQLQRLVPRLVRHLEHPPHEFAERARALGASARVVVAEPGSRVGLVEPDAEVGAPPRVA